MKKNKRDMCPECGEDLFTDVIDMDSEDDAIYMTCTCCCCGAVWVENFALAYCGYSIGKGEEAKYFDIEGNET